MLVYRAPVDKHKTHYFAAAGAFFAIFNDISKGNSPKYLDFSRLRRAPVPSPGLIIFRPTMFYYFPKLSEFFSPCLIIFQIRTNVFGPCVNYGGGV